MHKMRKLIRFLLIGLFIIEVGCSREMEQPFSISEVEEFLWSPKANQCWSHKTKTTLNGTTLAWEIDDEIGVFVDGIQDNKRFINIGGTSFSGSFVRLAEKKNSVEYYAYYPFVPGESRATKIRAILPSVQKAPFDASADFMIANVEQAKYDETDMPSVTFHFDNQLMSIVKVQITNSNPSLTGQKLRSIELEAIGGETLAGPFSFDVTAPSTPPVFSASPSEVTNKVIASYSEEDAPVLGSNTAHNVYLLVNPIDVGGLKVVIKTTDNVFEVTSSKETNLLKGTIVHLPAIDLNNLPSKPRVRRCVLWGDSITASPHYPEFLQKLLGDEWQVIGGGIGGDGVQGITCRLGANPICLKGAFTIPASNQQSVSISGLYSTVNIQHRPGLGIISRESYATTSSSLMNPVVIKFNDGEKDVEIEGVIKITGDYENSVCTFKRATSGEAVNVPDGATVITYGAREYKDADIVVIYMGANLDYIADPDRGLSKDEVLVEFYKDAINYVSTNKVVVVGFHMGFIHWKNGNSNTYWTDTYRNIFYDNFGEKYLDLKTEGIADAYNLLVETGAYTPGQDYTMADEDALDAGYWPESFQQTHYLTDVHHSRYGLYAMAILVKRKMEQLGYLDY